MILMNIRRDQSGIIGQNPTHQDRGSSPVRAHGTAPTRRIRTWNRHRLLALKAEGLVDAEHPPIQRLRLMPHPQGAWSVLAPPLTHLKYIIVTVIINTFS